MVFRSIIAQVADKRVPLIKFRKGGSQLLPSSSSPHSHTQHAGPNSTIVESQPTNAIEDWELPSRYKRLPITNDEMEYINRGGPA
ncbi:28S ribosomal protein S36, mitochondrial isoform X1 [Glossina fuscipes]|uniref:28S ribosomal protein S36, mitochondrial isoform X1 n=1 Tax=Glossina fuscipes TaxID=7396 RepID=A0A9C5ZJR7_9MUSC|nr:28S ribosomal protein S36, mitochondrial isoform X1 [Glossina fuscipes]